MEAARSRASLLAVVTDCITWVSEPNMRDCGDCADSCRFNTTLRHRNLCHPLPALEI